MKRSPESTVDVRRARLGYLAVGAGVATVVLCLIAFAGRRIISNDFYAEALPAYRALFHGDVLGFVRLGPQYVGSLIFRAPFALIAHWLGASSEAVYFATALPCLLGAPLLGGWLSASQRGSSRRVSPIVLFALSPLAIDALLLGHPEEVLGAVLCVAAVELAVRGRTEWAGVLAGLAVVNKSWAIVAIPVVLVALPGGRRRALAIVVVTAAAVIAPVTLIRVGGASVGGAAAALGTPVGSFLLTPELLWWFGRGSWTVDHAHYILVIASFGCVAFWWVLRRKRTTEAPRRPELLLLLALVFLVRAALDPEDNLYYHVPFVLAIMAYEAGRPARITTLITIVLLIAVPPAGLPVAAAIHALLYAAFAVPTILWLAWRCHRPEGQSIGRPSRLRPPELRRASAPGERQAELQSP